jgi:putative DNA primase/helicase
MLDTIKHIEDETDAHMHDYIVAQEHYDAVKDDANVSDEVRGGAKFKLDTVTKRIEDILKFKSKCETRDKISAGIDIANCDERVLVSYSQFNRDPWLLNFKNGTVDLHTGQLHEHEQRDYITRMVPHAFDSSATCPIFDTFLAECMGGKGRMVNFLWRLIGYSTIGVTSEQILVMCIGEGANGKSTFMNVILEALGLEEGGYAWAANSENLLTTRGGNKHETWRMSLFGRRLVAALEVEEGRSFAESLIKELTGSDRITGRKMHQDEWSYAPMYQLWLSANHLPHIRGTDEGIWRRIMVVPWPVSFRGREDKNMPEKLKEEIPGILARAVREAVAWRQEGLRIPREVVAATMRYRREQDPLQPFFDACCVIHAGTFVRRSLLWTAYLDYIESSKSQTFHEKKRFLAAIEKRFKEGRRQGEHVINGIRLKTKEERLAANPRLQLIKEQKEEEEKKKFNDN